MTHSYPFMAKEFAYTPEKEEEQIIKEYILSHECDDYDKLLQMCDSLSVDYGFCILEKRFIDVARRYGVWENSVDRWNATFDIKEYFEERIGCSIYSVLPNIGETTLICQKPWNPPSPTNL